MQVTNNAVELKRLGEAIQVSVRESSRAKVVSVRINHRGLELVVPRGASRDKAYQFLLQQELWIREKLADRNICLAAPTMTYKKIPLLGVAYDIRYSNVERECGVVKSNNVLTVYAPFASANDVLKQYLKVEALREIMSSLTSLAEEYKFKPYGKVVVRDVVSRWGSCSSRGNLSFNWRIIFTPREVFYYVVVHEFCHLKELNHGKKFWSWVAKLCPDYLSAISWLKKNSYHLHQYFSNVQGGSD